MDFSHVGGQLGAGAARGVKRIEQGLGVYGWPLTCFAFAVFATKAAEHGMPSGPELLRPLSVIALWGAMLGASILLRRPSRWLSELGLKLGFWSAAAFGIGALGISLFAVKNADTVLYGSAALLSAEISAGLCAFAAWHDWEQVEAAFMSLRRYINGANGDGEWSAFRSAIEPLPWLALSLFAIAAAASPREIMQALWKSRDPMPVVLQTQVFWAVAAALLIARLYVAFRRVGLGYVERGFYLWLWSLGEFIAAGAVCAAIYVQFQPNEMPIRLIAGAGAFLAAGIAWFCDSRRRWLVGR